MHFGKFNFGSLEIDGSTYEHDVVIDRGEISQSVIHAQDSRLIRASYTGENTDRTGWNRDRNPRLEFFPRPVIEAARCSIFVTEITKSAECLI